MTATKPLVADPAGVTDWSCPTLETMSGEGPHHLVPTSAKPTGRVLRCHWCKRTEKELREEQAAILAEHRTASAAVRAAATTVNVHQSILIPDGDIETLIEMAGFGIGYWAETAHHNRNLRIYQVWLDAEARGNDPHEEDAPHTRTLEYGWLAKRLVQLGLGIGNLEGVSPQSHVAGYAREYMATVMAGEPDGGIIDADLADVIVQLAYFNGKVVFG